MIAMVTIISVANMAKAMVKSSHEIGTLVFRLVNSKMMIRRVVKQQKHQQNMHQAQWDFASFGIPADAANAKQMHVRTTSTIRTMPIGRINDLKSTCNMTKLFHESQSLCFFRFPMLPCYILLSFFVQFHCAININKSSLSSRRAADFVLHREPWKINSQKFLFVVKLQFFLRWQQTCLIMLILNHPSSRCELISFMTLLQVLIGCWSAVVVWADSKPWTLV